MSKQLSTTQWKNCFKKYESYSQPKFWNYYARFKPNRTVNKDHKKRFKNIYNAYKTSIIHSMTGRKKASGRKKTSKIKKKIDWDIFKREGLIKIAKDIKKLLKKRKRKRKIKWRKQKTLICEFWNLLFYLVFQNQDITKIEALLTNLEEIRD